MMKKDKAIIFFGESAFYSGDDEKIKAKEYLEYWKQNLMKKLYRDTFEAVLIEESFHERGPEFSGMLCQNSQISLKLLISIKFRFEMDQCIGINYE